MRYSLEKIRFFLLTPMAAADSNCSRNSLHCIINFDSFFPRLRDYAFLFLAGTGLIVLGGERIAAGIRSRQVRRTSRLINIVIGAAIIV
jgi:hypothetical protein